MADGGGSPAPGAAAGVGAGVGVGVGFTAELGAEICARVAAGESLMAVCRGPGMPHRTSVRNWADARPEFAEALAAAQAQRRVRWRARDAGRLAERLARPKPAKGGRESTYTPQIGALICDRLMNGESVLAMARDPQMPCAGTIYAWANRHPEFVALYQRARTIQADYLFDEAREVALGATPKSVWADRLRFDVIRWMTARMAPKKYVERVQVDMVRAQVAAERDSPGRGEPTPLNITVTHFQLAPNGKVVAMPPRNARDEQAYEEAYGKPYEGLRHASWPGPGGGTKDGGEREVGAAGLRETGGGDV